MNTQTTYLASKPHYEILDGLRGVAAVMVIIFHLLKHMQAAVILLKLSIMVIWQWISSSCFPVLLSAYAYDDRWNRMTVGTFFKRRIIRLHPMVIMGSIVGAAFSIFRSRLVFHLSRIRPSEQCCW